MAELVTQVPVKKAAGGQGTIITIPVEKTEA